MTVLIIEDDPNKLRQISDHIRSLAPSATISERSSYQSGLREIVAEPPELILLDMSMPTYDISPTERGGRTRVYAGRDVLREMQRRGIGSKVIVVTQFESFGEGPTRKTLPELTAELRRGFPENYVTTVYYHPAQSDWKSQLSAAVYELVPPSA
jgi:CheY-like chemotaxis protein